VLNDLERAFDEYFSMIVEANRLALDREADDALRLVHLRRELSQRIRDVQHIVDEFARTRGLNETAVPQLGEHRTMFSAERRAVANHQAKWNAPAVQRDRNGYETDCKALFAMHANNHRWRGHVLLPALLTVVHQIDPL